MATLPTLVANGDLVQVPVELEPDEMPLRSLYGFPEFKLWLDLDLPVLETGKIRSDNTPMEQVDYLLYKWISGGRLRYGSQIKDLTPMKDEVWEFKSADIRIFGWFAAPGVFIAVFADHKDKYAGPRWKEMYDAATRKVLEARRTLNLDEPKYATGTFDDLVRVEAR